MVQMLRQKGSGKLKSEIDGFNTSHLKCLFDS